MKIAFVLPDVGLSGGVRIVFIYANYLVEKGHDVTCYYPLAGSYVGWKKYLFPIRNIYRWILSDSLKGKWFDNKFKLKHPYRIRNSTIEDADIVIATAWMTAYWVSELTEAKGKKVYFIQEYETWGKPKYNKMAAESYNLPMDLRISVSTALKERLQELNEVDSKVVCNGIPRAEIGDSTKKNGDPVRICFPYRNGYRKNCDFAIHLLRQIYVIKKVSIISFGTETPKEWETEWEYYKNPTRDDLQKIYSSTDIFYAPSLYEGWGLPAMEAMAHGCAVVGHDSGVIHEVSKMSDCCIVIKDSQNESEVMAAMLMLIDDYNLVRKLGTNAYQVVVNNLVEDKSKSEFEETLRQLLLL